MQRARRGRFLFILLFLAVSPAGAGAAQMQESPAAQDAGSFTEFDRWLQRYKSGEIVFEVTSGKVSSSCSIDAFDEKGEFPRVLHKCAGAGTREAARRILELAAYHFDRDPAVEMLQFRDRAPGRVRATALESLQKLDSPDVLEYLSGGVLFEREGTTPEKRVVAARALGHRKDNQAKLAIYSAVRDPNPAVRRAAIESAVSMGGVRASMARHWLDEDDPRVRLVALEAIAHLISGVTDVNDRQSLLSAARSALESAESCARDRAIDIFVNAPDSGSIPVLINSMFAERERIERGEGTKRFLYKLGETLQRITGYDLSPREPEKWRDWWKGAAEHFQLDAQVVSSPRTGAGGGRDAVLPVHSDRIIIIIDSSASMNEAAPAPAPRRDGSQPRSKGWTRLDRARFEVLKLLRDLDSHDAFQIIRCAASANVIFPELVPASRENKSLAEKAILALEPNGDTSLIDGISSAISFTTSTDRKSGRDGDTILLFSDGVSTTGPAIDDQDVLSRVRELNAVRRAEFYTYYIGTEHGQGRGLLEKLARDSHGEFRALNEKK
ncbi:MAG: HEAT repeat domain-containing protein [Planctomycetes bacterium]|nr:HEAT repeat domain-containing protein [Planctomycetota bacterium]